MTNSISSQIESLRIEAGEHGDNKLVTTIGELANAGIECLRDEDTELAVSADDLGCSIVEYVSAMHASLVADHAPVRVNGRAVYASI